LSDCKLFFTHDSKKYYTITFKIVLQDNFNFLRIKIDNLIEEFQ
jgi:hypothetical protein